MGFHGQRPIQDVTGKAFLARVKVRCGHFWAGFCTQSTSFETVFTAILSPVGKQTSRPHGEATGGLQGAIPKHQGEVHCIPAGPAEGVPRVTTEPHSPFAP